MAINGVGPCPTTSVEVWALKLTKRRMSFQFPAQQSMRSEESQRHKQAKTVDQFQCGQFPPKQIEQGVVEVGIHEAKLRQSVQGGMNPSQRVDSIQFDGSNVVAFHQIRRCSHPNVVGGVSHSETIFHSVLEQDRQGAEPKNARSAHVGLSGSRCAASCCVLFALARGPLPQSEAPLCWVFRCR